MTTVITRTIIVDLYKMADLFHVRYTAGNSRDVTGQHFEDEMAG